MRSMLFVPGNDPRKLDKAAASAADALIVDLEDAVAADSKAAARRITREFLDAKPPKPVFVRINALEERGAVDDLAAIVGGAPAGIMLPKCNGPTRVARLDAMLEVLEARDGLTRGAIRILPIAVELADAALNVSGYRGVSPRLCGLMWGVEDLAVDLASAVRDEDGALMPAIDLGRSLCLYAAAAAGVPAVDAVYANFRDLEGLAAEAKASRRAGFSTKAAIHPQQIETINAAFTPDAEAAAHARRIVEAFRQAPGQGAIAIDGRMYDRPHLRAAELLLGRLPRER